MRTVIVVGIHACGTRFIAKALHDSGIPMWHERPTEAHYEDLEILDLNIAELAKHGKDWFDESVGMQYSHEFMTALYNYKAKRTGEIYGFKEPRIAMLIGAYKKVWPDAKWICCVRNPLDAAKSHAKHGRLKDTKQAIITFTDNLNRIANHVVPHYFNYDGNMEEEEQRLSEYIGYKVELAKYWNK